MITKSGKHHWKGTLVHLNANGEETYRIDEFTFTAIDPQKYIEALRCRFPSAGFLSHQWVTTKIVNLVDLDA